MKLLNYWSREEYFCNGIKEEKKTKQLYTCMTIQFLEVFGSLIS